MDDGRKDVARVIEEQILDRGRLELIPEIFHPEALVHGPIYTIFLRPCHTHDEIRDHVVGNRTGFPDLHRDAFVAFATSAREALGATFSVELLVAEADMVAALVRITGTHRGEYFGRPATGNAVDIEVHHTWRVRDGQAVSLYGLSDWFSLAAQLGPIPSAPAAAVGEPVAEHPNAAVLRGAYAALAKGDVLSAYAVFDPNLVWHVPEGHRLAGVYEGRDSVFGMLGQLVTMTGGSLEMHVDHVLANDVRAVGLMTSTATRNGKDFVAREVHVFELENGRVKVFWTLPQVPFPAEYWAGAPIGDGPQRRGGGA